MQYREKSALHRQLGAGFKQVLLTTTAPGRIWTGNWSLAQIECLQNMVNPELLDKLSKNTLSGIILPLEKILAEGALNLWQCKQTQERRVTTTASLRPHSTPGPRRDTPTIKRPAC